jgi:uncharacterized protein YcnI
MRTLPPLLVVTVLGLVAAQAAFGHAVVRPAASRPAELQRYTLTVPNEEDTPTTSVAMQVPDGIGFFLVQPAPGWDVKLKRTGGQVSGVRWTGGSIPPDFYEDFHFIARNPVREGSIAWKVIQRYAGGSTVRWIGPPDSESPAAVIRLSEQVVPQDVVDVESGKAPAAAASGRAAAAAEDQETNADDDSDVPLIVAIVALATALAALGAALLGRSRKKTT